MTDRMTPEQRHLCMSHIHSKGTIPELKVRKWLWNHGYRYRLNVKSIPGKPDIVLRRYHTAIFVNGCFWHGHGLTLSPTSNVTVINGYGKITNSQCCKIPSSNRDFWIKKIVRNKTRDQKNYLILKENGWNIIVIWECQLTAKKIEQTMRKVELELNNNLLSLYKRPKPKNYSTEEETPLPMAAEQTV